MRTLEEWQQYVRDREARIREKKEEADTEGKPEAAVPHFSPPFADQRPTPPPARRREPEVVVGQVLSAPAAKPPEAAPPAAITPAAPSERKPVEGTAGLPFELDDTSATTGPARPVIGKPTGAKPALRPTGGEGDAEKAGRLHPRHRRQAGTPQAGVPQAAGPETGRREATCREEGCGEATSREAVRRQTASREEVRRQEASRETASRETAHRPEAGARAAEEEDPSGEGRQTSSAQTDEVREGSADTAVEPSELRKMHRLEDTYWWFVGRRRLVRRLIERYSPSADAPRRLLDVGCGAGATLRVLDEFGTVVGVDRSDEALRLSATRGPFALVQACAEGLPFPDGAFDVVTALDLLEHLDDDATAMREIARVLRPGGIAILTLPAYGFLWSEHDVALDHRRRYVAADCRRLLREAGMRQVRLTYAIALLFPPIFAFRAWQRIFNPVERSRAQTALRVLPGPINALLIRLLDWETALLLRANLPFGVSLVAVAEKPPART